MARPSGFSRAMPCRVHEKFEKPSRRQTEDDFGRLFVLPKMARRFDNYGSRHVRPWFCGGLGFWYRTCWLKKRGYEKSTFKREPKSYDFSFSFFVSRD